AETWGGHNWTSHRKETQPLQPTTPDSRQGEAAPMGALGCAPIGVHRSHSVNACPSFTPVATSRPVVTVQYRQQILHASCHCVLIGYLSTLSQWPFRRYLYRPA